MTITDISKKYEYHSVQEFCAIAKTFGYNYQYNRGYFLFSKDGNDFVFLPVLLPPMPERLIELLFL